MDYVKLYDAETEEEMSQAGEFENTVSLILRADLYPDQGSYDSRRLYLEAEEDYYVDEVKVKPVGEHSERWQLAPDVSNNEGAYEAGGEELELGMVGHGSNRVYFWAKAQALDSELPENDVTVTLKVSGIAGVV